MKTIIIVVILLVVLPNIFNKNEKNAFSDKIRVEKAKKDFHINEISDSIIIAAGDFYKNTSFHQFFYGKKYSELWTEPIKVKVFRRDTLKGGLRGMELGGGMQTIGLDLISKDNREYDMRSVNKDQSKALPKILRSTYARTLFRNQTISLNPYAALVLPTLANAIDIMHANPQLFFVPYDPSMKKEFRMAMAGRMVILEENVNNSWKGSKKFSNATGFYNTDEMFEKAAKDQISIDTTKFLKCRLFDILINDWDRHEGQWEWGLIEKEGERKFIPIPKDRDMAISKFEDGIFSSLALMFNNKFQSFTPEYKDVVALTHNGHEMDKKILTNVKRTSFVSVAQSIQQQISDSVVEAAFKNYPTEIFKLKGEEHIRIFKSRRDNLVDAAIKYHKRLH